MMRFATYYTTITSLQQLLYGFGAFCIRSRLLAKASCFFLSISAAEHFHVIWLVTKTGKGGREVRKINGNTAHDLLGNVKTLAKT